MDPKPFARLEMHRNLDRDDLPPELARFYERNEGVGLSSSPDRIVRLCLLSEIKEYTWDDVPIFGGEDLPGWNDFRGLRIGVSSFHDGLYWVRHAPCCPAGAILTFGPDIAGPGGSGDRIIDGTLVLAPGFDEWLTRLARHDWFEFGLAPGEIAELKKRERAEMLAYYRELNPAIVWPHD